MPEIPNQSESVKEEPFENVPGLESDPPLEGEGAEKSPRIVRAIGDFMGGILDRGKAEIEAAARSGKLHLEIRQLERDREAVFTKLGRELCRLVEAGEVEHPALQKGVEKVHEIERRLAELQPSVKVKEEEPEQPA